MNNTSLYTQKNDTAGGTATITGTPRLFIDVASGATSQAGFTTNDTDTTTVTTTDFKLFGTDVYWKATDGTLTANFWATTTDMDDVWMLVWNEPDDDLDDSTPVVVQTTPPASSSSKS